MNKILRKRKRRDGENINRFRKISVFSTLTVKIRNVDSKGSYCFMRRERFSKREV